MTKITLTANSAFLSVCPPDGYSWNEYLCDTDNREAEDYAERFNKLVGGVRRRDLPENHPEFLPAGFYETDGKKFLEKVLAKAWFSAFEDWLKARDKTIRLKAVLTGVLSPREYNFTTDKAEFNLSIYETTLEKVRKQVFAHESVFAEYLKAYHSDRPGFWSFVPDSVPDWVSMFWRYWHTPYYTREECEAGWRSADWTMVVMVLLDFWLFAFDTQIPGAPPSLTIFEENLEEFRRNYDREVEDLQCNGATQDCQDFVPERSEEFVPA